MHIIYFFLIIRGALKDKKGRFMVYVRHYSIITYSDGRSELEKDANLFDINMSMMGFKNYEECKEIYSSINRLHDLTTKTPIITKHLEEMVEDFKHFINSDLVPLKFKLFAPIVRI